MLANRMTPEELEEILDLAFCDGDEVAVVQIASKRQIYTSCCTYNYIEMGESPDPIPPCPKPKPKPK